MLRCGLLLLLAFVCVNGAPVNPSLEPGNCQDPFTQGAAEQALNKINQERRQGYVFALNMLNSAHHTKHGSTGVVFYLILDVQETKCHVLSKRDWKSCEVRQEDDTPVYGQCSATIYINKVKRIVQLHRYDCRLRPAPASRIVGICPDCPTAVSTDNESVLKTVKMAMEKYNRESGNANYFALLKITRASAQGGIVDYMFADFTIQETVCSNETDVTEAAKCAPMDCEFGHKGHCKASYYLGPGEESVTVNCDIFEPEEANKEKQRHLLGGEHDHSHNATQEHIHGDTHEHDHAHGHGRAHYHTHEHDHVHHHDNHDHVHHHDDHDSAHKHDHSHDHDQDHGHKHDHTHNDTHDHAHDHIHYYGDHHHHHHHHHHGNHTHPHEHFHDHEHNHTHLHAHEHHHHHHDHSQRKAEKGPHGSVQYLPDLDRPVTMPSFPDQPELERPVTMPSFPDTETPSEDEKPHIVPFPTGNVPRSPECLIKPLRVKGLISELFDQDPLFKPTANV